MKIENATWNPTLAHGRGRKPAQSVAALRSLQVGDVKRIVHDDVVCRIGMGGPCTLAQTISRLHAAGWELQYYHEDTSVLVVKRTK